MAEKEKVKKPKNKKVLEETHEEESEIEELDPVEELRKEIALLKSQIKEASPPYDPPEGKSQKNVGLLKPKKERTEKQKEAFTKALEARKSQVEVRKKMKEEADAKAKQILEDKILKKAIKVKKKQIKQLEMLKPTESESEEEDNDEIEKEDPKPPPAPVEKKVIQPVSQPTSKYRFF